MREEEEKRRKEKKRKEKGKVSSNSEIPSRTNQLSLSLPLSSIRIQFTTSRLHLKSQSIFLSFHHLLTAATISSSLIRFHIFPSPARR